ncbi:MAG: hypothetical protein KC421_22960 [Anaerolineales bacterium]|nr:hypothetical protein [Anaerolineales bacterium]
MGIYNKRRIFKLLHKGFNVDHLKTLCLDDDFEKCCNEIGNNEGKIAFIRKLIVCADQRMLLKDLLEWAKKENPKRYKKHGPYFKLKEVEKLAQDEQQRQKNLRKYFNLDEHDLEITIYLSRHSAATSFPTFTNFFSNNVHETQILNNIRDYQQHESHHSEQDADEFAVVSAIDMLEAINLKNKIEKSRLREAVSKDFLKEILKTNTVKVKIAVCPEPDDYEEMLSKGTIIFIGGPRANLGTYYYLYGYGSEAGTVRLGRVSKNVIECINDPGIMLECNQNHNMAVIQKHKIVGNDKTIFYLAGTGVNGTAAAIAYLRKNWLKLLDEYDENNFFKIIEVEGGKKRQDDLASTTPEYHNWGLKELPCK